MKRYILSLIGLFYLFTGIASGLGTWRPTMLNAYHPLNYISFNFDEPLGLAEDARVFITHEKDTIITSNLLVDNFHANSGEWSGRIYTIFSNSIYLPKGESYKFIIEADMIFSLDDPSKTNDRIEYDYNIPSTIGEPRYTSFDINKPVTKMTEMGVFFSTETAVAEGGRVHFYREGIFVRDFPAHASWDWNLGFGGVSFETEMKFEKDVNYTMVIPEGTITGYWRPDISNEEVVVNFFGGSPNLPAPEPKSWTIEDAPLHSNPGFRISLLYDNYIALLPNSQLSIVNEDGLVIGEAIPFVETKEGKSDLTARFLYIPQPYDQKWTLVIPEGTVVFSEGNMVVNHENRIDLSASILNEAQSKVVKIEYAGDFINVKGCSIGSRISLASMDGRLMDFYHATGEDMSIPAPTPGIYVVCVDTYKQKIHVK